MTFPTGDASYEAHLAQFLERRLAVFERVPCPHGDGRPKREPARHPADPDTIRCLWQLGPRRWPWHEVVTTGHFHARQEERAIRRAEARRVYEQGIWFRPDDSAGWAVWHDGIRLGLAFVEEQVVLVTVYHEEREPAELGRPFPRADRGDAAA